MADVVAQAVIEVETDTHKVSSDVTQAGKKAGGGFKSGFASSVKGLAAVVGIAALGAGVSRLISGSMAEAREAQKVGATTEAIIKSTGGTANVTAGQVESLSKALSKKAGVDDELIQSGANLLLTFKNVANEAGKGNAVFDRANQAALDLSAAGFGSISSTAKQMGKALNDPVKGISALGRAGVTFTQGQKDQIAAMVANNDLLGAQKIILGEVESQVGGVAAAQATAGDKAKVAWGNMKEAIGTALIPVVDSLATAFVEDVIPALSATADAIASFIGFLRDNSTVILTVAAIITAVFLPALIAMGITALTNAALVGAAWLIMQAGAIAAMISHSIAIVTMIAGWVAAGVAAMASAVVMAAAWFIALGPIGWIIAAVIALVAVIVLLWKKSETFRTIVTGVWNAVKAAVAAVLAWFAGPFKSFFTSTLPAFFRAAWNAVRSATISAWNTIIAFFRGIPGKVSGVLSSLIGRVRSIFTSALSAARTAVTGGISTIMGLLGGLPGKVSALAGRMLSAGKSVGASVINGIRAGLTAVGGMASDVANAVRNAINGMLGLPRTIGKGPLKFTIPAFAQGTMNSPGGIALVGENGPELVNLPAHSRVIPAPETRRMATDLTSMASPAATAFPHKMILRVGGRDFVAFLEEIADNRIDAADSLAWQGA